MIFIECYLSLIYVSFAFVVANHYTDFRLKIPLFISLLLLFCLNCFNSRDYFRIARKLYAF